MTLLENIIQFLAINTRTIFLTPPYPPELVPCDFVSFPISQACINEEICHYYKEGKAVP